MLVPTGKPRWAVVIGLICGAAVLITNFTDESIKSSIRLEEPWLEAVSAGSESPAAVHRSCFQKNCETANGQERCVTSRTACAPIAEWTREFAPYFSEYTHQVPSSELDFNPFAGAKPKLSKKEKHTLKAFKDKIEEAQKKYGSRIKAAEAKAEKHTDKLPLGKLLHFLRKRHEEEKKSHHDEDDDGDKVASSSSSECIEKQCVVENGSHEHCKTIKTNCGGMGNQLKKMMGGMGHSPLPFPHSSPASQPEGPDSIPLDGGGLAKVLKKLIKNGKIHVIRIGPPPTSKGPGPNTPAAKKLWKAEFGGKKNDPKKTSSKKDKKKKHKKE